MGIPKKNTTTGKLPCNLVSSACVTWDGPDIPCLNLCKGDNVQTVVYELGKKLCDMTEGIINISELNISCYLPGQEVPTTVTEVIQLLSDQICHLMGLDPQSPGGEINLDDVIIDLPSCLHFEEDGVTITKLQIVDYVTLLAETICDIKSDLENLNSSYISLEERVTDLEDQEPSPLEDILIGTSCLSGVTPGEELDIKTAFENLEENLCDYISLVGENPEINTTISLECTGLKNEQSLSNSTITMKDISGWVSSPSSLAESINNLWITVCDMRTKVSECCGEETLCATIAPFNLEITNVTSTGCTVTWDEPKLGNYSTPLSYTIDIYRWSGTETIGTAEITSTVNYGETSYDISGVLYPGLNYVVYLTADYTCGNSAAISAYGIITLETENRTILLEESTSYIPDTCGGVPYNISLKTITATLKDDYNNTVINTWADITIRVKIEVTELVCPTDIPNITYEELEITIPTGYSLGSSDYEANKQNYCEGAAKCLLTSKTAECVTGISTVDATLNDGSFIIICE